MATIKLSRSTQKCSQYPVKVLQIGAGNFARAYTVFAFQCLNNHKLSNAGVAIATSSPERGKSLNAQDGLYTVVEASLEGSNNVLIDSVQEQFSIPDNFKKFLSYAENLDVNLITSNTTEVGITYQEEEFSHNVQSFPARLAVWLGARHKAYLAKNHTPDQIFILPSELIENNGDLLRTYIIKHAEKWGYSADCMDWLHTKVKFYNTLVDRIVPGYPDSFIEKFQKEWGYEDDFAVLAEKFFFLAIQGDTEALDKAYPLSKLPLNIVYTNDLEFYRKRKVSFLNGAHTVLLGLAMLAGFKTVQDTLKDTKAVNFLRSYLTEACSALDGDAETKKYIDDVLDRFSNPYLSHKWEDILLNALSKFVIRNVPVMLAQEKKGINPEKGLKALAALLTLYFKGIQKDSRYADFQKLSDQHPDRYMFSVAFLADKHFFSQELPVEKWAPQLAHFIEALEVAPADGFK